MLGRKYAVERRIGQMKRMIVQHKPDPPSFQEISIYFPCQRGHRADSVAIDRIEVDAHALGFGSIQPDTHELSRVAPDADPVVLEPHQKLLNTVRRTDPLSSSSKDGIIVGRGTCPEAQRPDPW